MTLVRIVLADDHALVRAGIYKALAGMPGYEIVAEASDGPSVEAALVRSQPDLLLIDVAMPSFDPLAAIKGIRDAYPDMKILVISAHDDNVYVRGLLGAGVDGYHLKDESLSELRMAVERVMGGQKWVTGRLLDRLAGASGGPSDEHRPDLSSRKRDIISLLQAGFDNQTIAHRMGLSVKTVEKHLTGIYRHLGRPEPPGGRELRLTAPGGAGPAWRASGVRWPPTTRRWYGPSRSCSWTTTSDTAIGCARSSTASAREPRSTKPAA